MTRLMNHADTTGPHNLDQLLEQYAREACVKLT